MKLISDSGLIVPCVSPALRDLLLQTSEQKGLTFQRQNEMMGRSVAEMTLQLMGGGHRYYISSVIEENKFFLRNVLLSDNYHIIICDIILYNHYLISE